MMNTRRWASIVLFALASIALPVMSQAQTGSIQEESMAPDSAKISDYKKLVEEHYILAAKGQVKEAIGNLSRAMALIPNHPTNILLLGNMGVLEWQLGRTDQARLAFDAALVRDSQNARIRETRALLQVELGNVEAALTDYVILSSQNPDNEVYRYRKAMVLAELDRNEEAEFELEQIINQNDTSLKAREGLAMIYTKTGRYIEAERLYDYLIDKLPDNVEMIEGRARLHLITGKLGFALRDINRAFALAGNMPPQQLYTLRAEISEAVGDKKGAAKDREQAEKMQAQLP